ncbi:hypothetical protein AnigIFM63326_004406 [Aspergillus niger]|nr:hypothetical protein AnigIFM63326_004406 [Aspergillus niger]
MASLSRVTRISTSTILSPHYHKQTSNLTNQTTTTATRQPSPFVRTSTLLLLPSNLPNQLPKNNSICDLQEKFRHAIYEFPKVINTTTKLLRATQPLQIPIYITTQSRAKLGNTVPELTTHLTNHPLVRADLDKTLFSMITPEMEALLPSPEKGEKALDVIIVGIETHICVLQTTMDLLRRGHRVYVCVDGVSSVNKEERGVAVQRMRDAGAIVTTSESLLFEMLGDAGHEGFKVVSGLVREMKEETRGAVEGLAKI